MPKIVDSKIYRELLIVACGRSGTKHIAHILRRGGAKIGHEQVKADGVSSAFFVTYGTQAGDISPNIYQPYVHRPNDSNGMKAETPNTFKFNQIWHQVRDPLKTIGSVRDVHKASIVKWSRDVLKQECIHEKLKHDLEYAARHWLLVNQLAKSIAEWRYRVEDIETVWPEMVDRLKLRKQEMPNVSKTMGRSYRTIKQFRSTQEIYDSITYPTWADIKAIDKTLHDKILALAKEFGYA